MSQLGKYQPIHRSRYLVVVVSCNCLPLLIGNDYFAMQMYYNESLGALSQAGKYNGNITAIKWKEGFGNTVEDDAKAFAYSYYKNDQLQKAAYGKGASFADDANAFNEESLTYDANGNIKTLQRKGISNAGSVTTIDNLSYTYDTGNKNKLLQVEDASSNTVGFNDGASSSTEFGYDSLGNISKDLNKGIDSVAYNELNKVKAVYFSGGKNLKYTYDAAGTKLAMEEYMNTTLVKSTKYVGGFVYENDTLRFFASPEGRVVVDNGSYEYQYALSDHQGNTRTVFTSKQDTLTFIATFEPTASGLREDTDMFENLDVDNEDDTFAAANHTPDGDFSYRMNQTTPSGPGIMLRVYPGDTVDPEVYAYFNENSGYGTSSNSLAAMITAIAGAFGGVNGGGGESQSIYDAFDDALGVLGLGGNQGDDTPAAYLNYIFFDETDGYSETTQDDDAGWLAVPSGAYNNQTLLKFTSPIVIKKPGYIYIYLSYENVSNKFVYFDDFKVNYTKSQIVQSNNYYAFGLQTKDSWTRIDTKPNQYLYNAGSEYNAATDNYEMPFRSYDPALGRMNGVDIMVDQFSSITPYQYAANDPVRLNDPTGAITDDTPWAQERWRRGKYQYSDSFADWARQSYSDFGGGFFTYQNFYGSGWNNQMNNGSSFANYGVATGWSDGVANGIIQMVQAANNARGDALALQAYGEKYGERGEFVEVWREETLTSSLITGEIIGSTTSSTFLGHRLKTASGEIVGQNFSQQQSGSISIINSSDQAIINQFVDALYDARAQGKTEIDLKNYFTEYSLGKRDRSLAFAGAGRGKYVRGFLNLRDGGTPIGTVISFNLSENFSILPTTPNSPTQGTDRFGDYINYSYYYEGSKSYPGLGIKGYTPSGSDFDRFENFIWSR